MEGKSHLRFARLAPFYDLGVRLCGMLAGGEETIREKVLDLLPLKGDETVLEVGCGTGTVSTMIARRLAGRGMILGLDPSPEMLSRAKDKLSGILSPALLIEGTGSRLPLPDASADCIVLFLTLHEMAHGDRLAALREGLRVLKPGGHLLIGELHRPSSPLGRLLLQVLLLVEEEEASDFFRRGLENILAEAVGDRLERIVMRVFVGGLGQGILLRRR
jgi:ubiquinone/menaquinone biosynthesis C-methylase UbiE